MSERQTNNASQASNSRSAKLPTLPRITTFFHSVSTSLQSHFSNTHLQINPNRISQTTNSQLTAAQLTPPLTEPLSQIPQANYYSDRYHPHETPPWGDTMSHPSHTILRLYSLNVNGFKITKHDSMGGTYHEFCKSMAEPGINICCLQELNLDIDQQYLKQLLHRITSTHFSRGKLFMGQTPTNRYETFYKPGGTAIILNDVPSSRYKTHRIDPWGRWVGVLLRGRGEFCIAIYSIYQPTKASWQASAGSNTIVAQQFLLLRNIHGNFTQTPREKFKEDFLREVSFITQNVTKHILITGDFNESYPSSFFSQLMNVGDLTHLASFKHPHLSLPATYFRGTTCLDHALGSPIFCNALQRCGYEPYSLRYHSDHRALFLEFSLTTLFNIAFSPVPRPIPRRLQSTSLSKVVRYVLYKYKYLEQHNFFARLNLLPTSSQSITLAEALDKDLTQASLYAESKLKYFPTSMWSITILKARLRVTYYKLRLSELTHHRNLSHSTTNILKNYGATLPSPSTISECSTLLRNAQTALQNTLKEHRQHRDQEFNDKIDRLSNFNDDDSKKLIQILRNIRKAEETKRMFQKLNQVHLQNSQASITQLLVPVDPNQPPKNCTQWQTLDIPSEILQALHQRNIQHFNQAHGTPFTVPPLSTCLGYSAGGGEHTINILQGTHQLEGLDHSTQQILSRLSEIYFASLEHPQLSPSISLSEMSTKFKIWPERTSTSPSGLHLGHYKSLIKQIITPIDCDDNMKEQYRDAKNKQQKLLDAHHVLLNFALERGYTFQRWQTITSSIIPKDPTDQRIHRVRVIHLFEADYNLFLAVKWRQLIQRAESLSLLNPGQYGSRAHRNAYDPVFLEIFQRQIAITTRSPLIQLNFDATSCYDRIIPSLAGLTSMAMGMSATNVMANNDTLQKARYHLHLGNQSHSSFYSHQKPLEVYGTGQGSGNSPFVWCTISSILFDCFDTQCVGATYFPPDKSYQLRLGMLGFVDDSNGQVNGLSDATTDLYTLLTQANQDAQLWHNLLRSSGGELEPSKCSFHVIHWSFRSDGSPQLVNTLPSTANSYLSRLSLLSTFQYLQSSQAHKTLGTYQIPNGDNTQQFKALLQKAETIRSNISRSLFTRKEGYTFYHAILLPSMTYIFPTSFFSKTQLDKVQSKCTLPLLPKLGYNRHTARAILYAPQSVGGSALRDFYITQGNYQIQTFLKYWRRECHIGRLLKITASWIQLSLGVGTFFLTDVSTPLPHFEADWFSSLRQFLFTNQLWITITTPSIITPHSRLNDSYLMDCFLRANIFSNKQIKVLNYCRLFMNVLLVSDITTVQGTSLLSRDILYARSKSQWSRRCSIHQSLPPPRAWKIWEQALLLLATSKGRLHQPLGQWILPPTQLSYIFKFYTNGHTLYMRSSNSSDNPEFYFYPRIPGTTFDRSIQGTCRFKDLPNDAYPIEARLLKGQYCVLSDQLRRPIPQPSSDLSWLHDPDVPLVIHHKRILTALPSTLSSGYHVASDASVRNGKAAFGWIFAHSTIGPLAIGKGRVPGTNNSSYRAEAWGILSALRFLRRLQTHNVFDISKVSWSLECDNLSVVNAIQKLRTAVSSSAFPEPNSPEAPRIMQAHYYVRSLKYNSLTSDWDILYSLYLLSPLYQTCQVVHVKGHQDTQQAASPLSFSAQLNIRCDSLASQAHMLPDLALHLVLPTVPASLHSPGGVINGEWSSAIRYHCSLQQYKRYYLSRKHWDELTWDSVDWKSFSQSLTKFPQRRTHLIKYTHEILPTNFHLHRIGLSPHVACTFCSANVETMFHLLQCNATQACEWRSGFLIDLAKVLEKLHTDQTLASILRHQFSTLFGLSSTFSDQLLTPEYQTLWKSQELIGWHQLLLGRYSIHWEHLQNQFLDLHFSPSPRPLSRWTSSIICFVWKKWIQLWDSRNQILHGGTYQESRDILRAKLLQELKELVADRHRVEPSLRDAIPRSISDVTCWSTNKLSTWTTLYRDAMSLSISSFATRCSQGMQSISTYFRRLTRPISPEVNSANATSNTATEPPPDSPPPVSNHYFQDINAPPWVNGRGQSPSSPLPSEQPNGNPDGLV